MRPHTAHSFVVSLLIVAFVALGTVTLGHAVTHADPGDCAACMAVSTTPAVLVAAALLTVTLCATITPHPLAPAPAFRPHHALPALRGPPRPL